MLFQADMLSRVRTGVDFCCMKSFFVEGAFGNLVSSIFNICFACFGVVTHFPHRRGIRFPGEHRLVRHQAGPNGRFCGV